MQLRIVKLLVGIALLLLTMTACMDNHSELQDHLLDAIKSGDITEVNSLPDGGSISFVLKKEKKVYFLSFVTNLERSHWYFESAKDGVNRTYSKIDSNRILKAFNERKIVSDKSFRIEDIISKKNMSLEEMLFLAMVSINNTVSQAKNQ